MAAIVRSDQTAHVLSMIHRMGHGHHARLIRETGDALSARLVRCGVSGPFHDTARSMEGTVVLIVETPMQSIPVRDLLLGLGAIRVERFESHTVASSLLSFDTNRLRERGSRRSASRRHPT